MQAMRAQNHLSVKVPPRYENKQIDSRWNQIKIHNSFTPRSNFGFTAQGNIAYLYGGYNIDQGKLDDLYTAKFDEHDHRNWQLLPQNGTQKPGKLRGHTLVSYRYFLICLGGQKSILENNGNIYTYNLKNNNWKVANVKSQSLSKQQIQDNLMRDSHSSFVVGTFKISSGNSMYVFGGYQTHLGLYSNTVFKLDLNQLEKSNNIQMEMLKIQGDKPVPRGNCGSCVVGNHFYIFGGTDSHHMFRDFWVLDLEKNTWEQIKRQSEREFWPEERKGGVLGYHEGTGNIFMFGGLKSITKQQNDVSIYMPSKKKWIKIHSTTNNLYDPSPTMKKQIQDSPTILQSKHKKSLNTEFKIGMKPVDSRFQMSKNSTQKNFNKKAYKTEISLQNDRYGYHQPDDTNINFNKKPSMVRQKRHKEFLIRKKKLLAQITKGCPDGFKREMSPVSESLNYSVKQIGEQANTHQNEEEEHREIPKVIFDVGRDLVIGKKPCARDGHASFVHEEYFYIVGGDRHNVSFNDIYAFRLDKGIESVQYYS